MSQFDEKVQLYKDANKELGMKLSDELITAVAKSLGPSIYNNDSSLVSSSDSEELARVKKNFLIAKLGLEDGPALDDALAATVNAFGSSNRNKYRALFYAYLVKHFGKEAMYS